MNFADMHNDVHFDFVTPGTHEFATLCDILMETNPDYTHMVRAIYINTKGKYGDAAVLITDKYKVNLPIHLTPKIKNILASPQSVQAINDGKVGFDVTSYENEFGTQFSIKWVNVINVDK